jgi:hypothetical protein
VADLHPWQLTTTLAFAANVLTVSIPGRIDGEMQKRVAEEKRLKQKAKVEDDPADGKTSTSTSVTPAKSHGIPLDSEYRSLFTPAGWAFAIWGMIYTGEMAMTVYCLANATQSATAKEVAPMWAIACGLQSLWCAAFRPWASKPRHFWVSSALLVAEACALGRAHNALRAAASGMTRAQFWTTHVPLSLHFGWISCASLVNINSHVAKTCGLDTQVAFAFMSSFGAAALGVAVSAATGDPIYACVIAWALSAVASDGGKRTSETLADTTLRALAKAARWSARIALVGAIGTRAFTSS